MFEKTLVVANVKGSIWLQITFKLQVVIVDLALAVSAFLFTVTLACCTSCTSIQTFLSFSLQKSWLLSAGRVAKVETMVLENTKRHLCNWLLGEFLEVFNFRVILGRRFSPNVVVEARVCGNPRLWHSLWEPTAFFLDFDLFVFRTTVIVSTRLWHTFKCVNL